MVPTPLWFLITKIVKLKFRSPGLWLTWQELATLFGYSLGMVWVLAYAVNPVTVPLSPAPAPIGISASAPHQWCGTPPSTPGSKTQLLFAPDTPLTRSVVQTAVVILQAFTGEMGDGSCHMQGFPSASALLGAYSNQTATQADARAAILFNTPTPDLTTSTVGNFTIAVTRDSPWYSEEEKRDFAWPQIGATHRAFAGTNDDLTESPWVQHNFVGLQYALDRAVLLAQPGQSIDTPLDSFHLQVTRFPTQPFSSTYGGDSTQLLGFLLPLIANVPGIIIAFFLSQFLVIEKVWQLTEGLVMMGMSYTNYYGSWLLVYGPLMVVWAVLETAGLGTVGYFPNTSVGLIFLTFLLASVAMVNYNFFTAGLSKGDANDAEEARQKAQGISFLLMVGQIGLFAIIYFADVPDALWYVFALIPQVGSMGAISIFISYEAVGEGMGWAELADSSRGPSLLIIWPSPLRRLLLLAGRQECNARHRVLCLPAGSSTRSATAHASAPPAGLKSVVQIKTRPRFRARPARIALANLDLDLYEG